ncbi:ribosomal RNA small subunit methyltransferase E [Campylobacterota bacterium]|nr:ribosomal RNA small subunit methyltransferase E [Campylobacterota bacterium]
MIVTRFIFHTNAGEDIVLCEGETLAHIKALRTKLGESISLRNLRDDFLYIYVVERYEKRSIVLRLIESKEHIVLGGKISLAWCVVDPKTIEKTLPFLNELGVAKLTFILSARSQRNFRIDYDRADRILISSCEQCGRSKKMELCECSLGDFLAQNSNAALLDIGAETPAIEAKNAAFIVGPEGGFSAADYEILSAVPKFHIPTGTILRSETAAIYAASIALTNR